MALGTNHMTNGTGTVFIPEVWSMDILRAAENALVMAPLVKRFDSLVTNKGDTINIPNLSNLTATDKSSSTQVTFQSPTEANTQILINKHKHAGVMIEDLLKTQSMYDLMPEYTSKLGQAVAQAIDTDIIGEYANFTNTDVGSYGSDVTDAVVLAGMQALDLANAPDTERFFVVYPTQRIALMKIEKFISTETMGLANEPTIVRKGPPSRYTLGDLYGMSVYSTKQVPQDAGTPAQTHNIMFHKEALALALQQAPRTQFDYIIEYLGTAVVVDVIYGVKTIRADFGVEVRS